ncbi:MAG: S-layer homology domain-containing protein [Thermosipho sp. (in: Bacteria)]|nr:S-layer homology domain-containing protein [Thermosipho sp. (in: thermotogales)]
MKKTLIYFFLLFAFLSFSVEVVITDVSPFSNEYNIVKFLVENRIMELDESGKFKPALLVTRIDIAKVIYNVIKLYNLEFINEMVSKFTEVENISKLNKSLITGIDKRLDLLEQKQETLDASFVELKSTFSDFSTLVSKIPQLEANISNLIASSTVLEKQLSDKNLLEILDKIKVLEEEFVKKAEITNVENKIAALEEKYDQQLLTINNKLLVHDQILNNLEERNAQIENLVENDKTFSEKIENINKLVSNISQQVSQLASKTAYIEKLYSNFDFDNLKYLELIPQIQLKLKTLEDAQQKLNTLNMEVLNLKQSLNGIDLEALKVVPEKISNLDKRLSDIEGKVLNIDNKIAEIDNLKLRMDDIETRVERIEKLDLNGQKLSEISKNIENFTEFIDKTNKEISYLNEKNKELESNLNYLFMITTGSAVISLLALIAAFVF